jgi:hypothetical protein
MSDLDAARRALAIACGERDYAQAILRALWLAGHVPDGAWRRLVNCAVGLESEGDIERAEAAATRIVWDVEQSDRNVGGAA